ncbi:unnamed protein product, partial [Mesorhabditis belari]|uniref:B box-type domain-containing protein n=1 Tax=Mesorhabditis belari TaxID=2138241 RepID=A0AAF3ERV6_9BILA
MRVFESLNCIVCKQPYARVVNQPRSPRQLSCGLAMCNECFVEEEEMDEEERKHQCELGYCFDNRNFAYFLIDALSQEEALLFTPMGYLLMKPFKIPECPICHDEYFLNELPEMTQQMETIEAALMNAKDARSCNECHEKDTIDKMFYCSACSLEICAICAYKKHRSHEAIPLLEKQANQMLMELQEESRNVIKTYKDLVPELHKGLLEGIDIFETELLSEEDTLKDASTFADLREKNETFTKIKSNFESSAENYLPHLRRFDAEVKQLNQALKEIRIQAYMENFYNSLDLFCE